MPRLTGSSGGFEFGGFCWFGHLLCGGFGQALGEGANRRPSFQAVTLMGPSAIVALRVIVQHGLHFHDGLDLSVVEGFETNWRAV